MALESIYIAATVFGAGMVLIDLTGVLSHIGDDGDGELTGESADTHSGMDDASGDSDGAGSDTEGSFDSSGNDGGADSHDSDNGSVLMHKPGRGKSLVLRLITILKGIVYFALGFGATGWFATYSDYHWSLSLPLSLGMGLLTMVIAKLVRRMQRSELNSQISNNQLLMNEAEVLMDTGKGKIGKVRILYEGMYVDRYAKTLDEQDYYKKGSTVRVMEVADDFVYVGLV